MIDFSHIHFPNFPFRFPWHFDFSGLFKVTVFSHFSIKYRDVFKIHSYGRDKISLFPNQLNKYFEEDIYETFKLINSPIQSKTKYIVLRIIIFLTIFKSTHAIFSRRTNLSHDCMVNLNVCHPFPFQVWRQNSHKISQCNMRRLTRLTLARHGKILFFFSYYTDFNTKHRAAYKS